MELYAVEICDISEEVLNKLCLLIDSNKKNKIQKFIFKKDKIRTVTGDILVKTIIADKLDINIKHIEFDRNQYDKPYIKNQPQIDFNISHSGEYVVCAIDNRPIGIDIEKVKYIEYEEMARNFFDAREFDYIVNQDLNYQIDRFYEIWTLKESYIKCCGQGLSIPLNSFSIEVDKYENVKPIRNNKNIECIFKKFNIESGYKIAVCSLNKQISKNIIRVDHNKLINKYLDINV